MSPIPDPRVPSDDPPQRFDRYALPTILPNPDPTDRSVELVKDTKSQLQKELETGLAAARSSREAMSENFNLRISALDKAAEIFREDMTRVPTHVDRASHAVLELLSERFKVQERQFQVHDERFRSLEALMLARLDGIKTEIQASKDAVNAAFINNRDMVNAAFAASKEVTNETTRNAAVAIAKAENSTTEQIKSANAQALANASAMTERVNDVRDRLTRLEAGAVGASAERTELRAVKGGEQSSQGLWIAVAGLALSVAVVAAGWLSSIEHAAVVVPKP